MKIVVMIKQVPDAEEIFIDPVKFTLNRSQARGIINPSDENALEAALRIKEAVGGEITIISLGFSGGTQFISSTKISRLLLG